jgi:hypothetical protein
MVAVWTLKVSAIFLTDCPSSMSQRAKQSPLRIRDLPRRFAAEQVRDVMLTSSPVLNAGTTLNKK